jgi:hypothetical protein
MKGIMGSLFNGYEKCQVRAEGEEAVEYTIEIVSSLSIE